MSHSPGLQHHVQHVHNFGEGPCSGDGTRQVHSGTREGGLHPCCPVLHARDASTQQVGPNVQVPHCFGRVRLQVQNADPVGVLK
ncbi:MAG: hypothetical protein ACK559_17300, partial [bacterium]